LTRLTPPFRDLILCNSVEIVSSKKPKSNSGQQPKTTPDLVGRLLAVDPGEKRIGVAISDELQLTVRPLNPIEKSSWKKLLLEIKKLLNEFDAKGIVIGLPLSLDGIERTSALASRELARKFALSLHVPVFLQDERLTSREAEEILRAQGHQGESLRERLDSEAAVLILRDFIENTANRLKVEP